MVSRNTFGTGCKRSKKFNFLRKWFVPKGGNDIDF